jgi:hypothetical protein
MAIAGFYILIGDNQTGPWSLAQVQAFWRAGAVSLKTLYAQPGASEWKPLSAILDATLPAGQTPAPQPENQNADEQQKMIETVVNVMLPLEAVPRGPDGEFVVSESDEPVIVDLNRARRWLCEKLITIGFAPVTAEKQEFFSDYLSRFSKQEQEQAFGPTALRAYQKGDITPLQLISKADCLISLEQSQIMLTCLDAETDRAMIRQAKEAGAACGKAAAERMKQAATARLRARLGLPPASNNQEIQ